MTIQECLSIKADKRKTLWNPIKGQRRKIYILVDGVMQEYRKAKIAKVKNVKN
jgi:hypothetical protein